MALPSSHAIYDKVAGFRPEALEYRDHRFEEIIDAAGMRSECSEMIQLMKEQTQQAWQKYTRIGEPWKGQATISREDQQISQDAQRERKTAEKEIQEILGLLKERGVETVRVDIAISENSEILVGYNAAGGNLDPNDIQNKLARLLNDCLFVENQLVTKDSIIFQARSLGVLSLDSNGDPLPAAPAKIDEALERMKNNLEGQGVHFQLEKHDYKTVKQSIAPVTTQAPVEEAAPGHHVSYDADSAKPG